MLRTFAVALLAATMFSAPVLAQGGAAPAKSNMPAVAPAKTTEAVASKPTVKKSVKRIKHRRHYAHVRHIKHVKHVRTAKRVRPTTDARGGMQASKPGAN